MREYRGTLTEPGKESPYRNRSVEENLDLFARMQAGEFPDGSRTLRAKIDMASPNLNMRDPVMYRILHAEHHRTGDEWCIYPMYDFAHGQSDSIERITHSICTLEFEDHRPLYDWYVEQLGIYHPQQIEFDRLNLTYTLLSKRKLLATGAGRPRARLGRSAHAHAFRHPPPRLHARGHPQLLRRHRRFEDQRHHRARPAGTPRARGSEPARPARHGRAAAAARGDRQLPRRARWRRWKPSTIPKMLRAGTRQVPFSRVLYIEQDDFREDPPKQYFRLSPGREVRLRYGYFITCTGVVKNERGEVTEIHCTYDPATRGGNAPDGRKVKSTIHWVSAAHAIDAEVRLYDNLFTKANPNETEPGQDFTANLNPNSLEVLTGLPSWSLRSPSPSYSTSYQFERLGYFCADPTPPPATPSSTAPSLCGIRGRRSRRRGPGARGRGPGTRPVSRPGRKKDGNINPTSRKGPGARADAPGRPARKEKQMDINPT